MTNLTPVDALTGMLKGQSANWNASCILVSQVYFLDIEKESQVCYQARFEINQSMGTHADKSQEQTGKSAEYTGAQKEGGEATFYFEDNRIATVDQRKLQALADGSPQVEQTAQLQAITDHHTASQVFPSQREANRTGLPDGLKWGLEKLSGFPMDDVKVHYHSDKPAQLQAHAYAQGTDIHLASGQEKHLPHEAWHVVQQKQGRVRPTMQTRGVSINHDERLEQEADRMGQQVLRTGEEIGNPAAHQSVMPEQSSGTVQRQAVVQRVFDDWIIEQIVEQAAEIHAAFQNLAEQQTEWHVMLKYLTRIGVKDPAAADVEDLMARVRQANPDQASDDEASSGEERLTDAEAAELAQAHGWEEVSGQLEMNKKQTQAGKSHAPKGRVFTDGKGNFWGADNSMHATGAVWKYWTGKPKNLTYKGNVTDADPTTPVERGAQRTMSKKEKRKQQK